MRPVSVMGAVIALKLAFMGRKALVRRSCGALSCSRWTSTSKGRHIRSREKLGRSLALPTGVFVGQKANKDVYSGGTTATIRTREAGYRQVDVG